MLARYEDNAADLTLRAVTIRGGEYIIATYSWVTGPLAGSYDGATFGTWRAALAALRTQSDIVRRVYVRGF